MSKSTSQTLISHQYASSSSSTLTTALALSYTTDASVLSLSSSLTIDKSTWNFVYIGVDCTAGIYFTSIIAGQTFDETASLGQTTFSDTCFQSTLSSLYLTIGDSTTTSKYPSYFSHFRYYPSTLVTTSSSIRNFIGSEISKFRE